MTPAEQHTAVLAALDRLEAIARAATPGPWLIGTVECGSATVDGPDAEQDCGSTYPGGPRRREVHPLAVVPPDVDYGPVVDLADAEHIAANNPAVVLQQLAGRRRICERHAPYVREDGVYCLQCSHDYDWVPWQCDDYRDATAGLGVLDDTEVPL